ncbi:hypothetical protein [Aeromonas jandaei]|uniref:hypothetical protein n=1 Tax=Aeromonas jandaei TaxID=650 RepID=UPI002AA0C060|nr:hypothetical protein [Aeromonas jandaei]
MKYTLLLVSILISGCVNQLSEADFDKLSGLSANQFIKNQWQYNIFETGNDNVHLYQAALFVDKQVIEPSSNLVKLCMASGGSAEKKPFSEKLNIDTNKIKSLTHQIVISNAFGNVNRDAFNGLQAEIIKNDFYKKALLEYNQKGYFSDAIKCNKDGVDIWSVAVIPGVPFHDGSVDTLPIYLINL